MIKVKSGNILKSSAAALVNPINCCGAMGAGLAQKFRDAYPKMFQDYQAQCRDKKVRIGALTTFCERDTLIINFPTKDHWRDNSRLADIEAGLNALRRLIMLENIQSIAIPALGCGLGGLQWDDVWPQICGALGCLTWVDIEVYAPLDRPGRHKLLLPESKAGVGLT